MESSFDSDQLSHQTLPIDESDIETQLIAEQENASKQDIIDNLQKELSICRSQFEQSVAINKNVENVHKKNQKLVTELRNLQSSNEELSRRLEISIKANEELEAKIYNERYSSSQQISRETSEKNNELIKLKKNYENEIKSLNKKIESLESENEKNQLDSKLTLSKISRLIQLANQHFGFTFCEIDSLIEFLIQPPSVENNLNADQKSDKENDVEKKNRFLRQKLKTARRQISDLVKERENLDLRLKESEKKNIFLKGQFESQIEQIKEDNSNNAILLNDTISSLNAKIEKMKNENSKLKSELREICSQKVSTDQTADLQIQQPKENEQASKKSCLNDEFEILDQRNSELAQKLQDSEEKRDQISSQLKEIQTRNSQLELELENQKVTLEALKVVHEETLSEVATLRESLHNKIDNAEDPRNERKIIKKLKAKLDNAEKTIQLLKQNNYETQLQSQSDAKQKDAFEAEMKNSKSELEEAKRTIFSLNDELANLREINDQKPSLTPEDVIPNYAWRFPDFPQALSQLIEKVASNPLLQPVSKLNNAFKTIQKFYDEELTKKNENSIKLANEIKDLKNRFNKFIADISIAIHINPITVSEFLVNDNDEIVRKLTSLCNEFDNLKRKEACFNSLIDLLIANFDAKKELLSNEMYSNFPCFVSNLRNQMNCLDQKVKTKSRKIKQLKSLIKEFKQNSENEISSLKSEIDEKSNSYAKLKKSHDMLSETHQKMKKEFLATKKNFADFQSKSEEKELILQDEFEQKLNNAQSIHNMNEESLKKQLNQLHIEKENNRSTIEGYESTINNLKLVIDKDTKEIKEKEKIIINLTSDREAIKRTLEDKYKEEKAQIIKSYEKTISEIKKQSEEQRNDLERITYELCSARKKHKNSKQSIVALKRDNLKLENEIKSVNDQMKRERQINEAETNNLVLSTESNYEKKIQDLKLKCENEKKRIFSYVANEFRQFFNPSETIDERSFRSLLSRIKKEYDRLAASDSCVRRLIGVNQQQPIEEAISHLIT